MNITARNYAAQASRSLRSFYESTNTKNRTQEFINDIKIFKQAAYEIERSIHFCMPDGGKILNDNLKGISGSKIKLPYESVTIECCIPNSKYIKDNTAYSTKKRIILAQELTVRGKDYEEYGTFFSSIYFDEGELNWILFPVSFFIPQDVGLVEQSCKYGNLQGEAIITMRTLYDHMFKPDKENTHICKKAINVICHDVLWSLELIEALSCSNVSHEPIETIDPRKNAKRIKAGKLPIYETRILTIKAGKVSSSGKNYGGTHSSPRQHLRRGHIRRLEDKKIWVNACVVGKPENGVIDKNYHVKKYNHASA